LGFARPAGATPGLSRARSATRAALALLERRSAESGFIAMIALLTSGLGRAVDLRLPMLVAGASWFLL